MQVARDYGVLIEEDGVALRGLFIIDPKGILRCAPSQILSVYFRLTWCGNYFTGKSPSTTSLLVAPSTRPFGLSRRSSSPYVVEDLPHPRSDRSSHHLLYLQDEHGEVCPANWNEGSKTMKADPKGSLEYFETASSNGHANGVEKRKRED